MGPPGRDGLPGPRGASGRDGRDERDCDVGPPGVSAGLDLEGIHDIVKLVAQEEFQTRTFPPVASCPGWSANRPATSCCSILDCNPLAASGYCWMQWNTTSCVCFCCAVCCRHPQRPARGDDQHATIESGSLDHPTLASLYTFECLRRMV